MSRLPDAVMPLPGLATPPFDGETSVAAQVATSVAWLRPSLATLYHVVAGKACGGLQVALSALPVVLPIRKLATPLVWLGHVAALTSSQTAAGLASSVGTRRLPAGPSRHGLHASVLPRANTWLDPLAVAVLALLPLARLDDGVASAGPSALQAATSPPSAGVGHAA